MIVLSVGRDKEHIIQLLGTLEECRRKLEKRVKGLPGIVNIAYSDMLLYLQAAFSGSRNVWDDPHLPCNILRAAKSLQSCPTLCDPRDGSPPGSPVSGILQARTLEWVAISFSNA